MWSALVAFASRLRAFVSRRRLDEATRQDCETHLALLTERNVRAGMTSEEARAAAHRQFGNTTLLREEIYRMNRIAWIEVFAQDLRHAVRSLRRSPAFTIAAVLTLAIGIGATTAIFSTVNATLLRPLPYENPEELVDVRTYFPDGRATTGLVSAAELGSLSHSHLPVERAAGMQRTPTDVAVIQHDGTPVRFLFSGVTEGFFDVLGSPMVLGPGFRHEDFLPSGAGAPMAMVISSRVWTTSFNRDRAIVGKTLRIVGVPVKATIVGVAAPGIDLPHGTDVWYANRVNPRSDAHTFEGILRVPSGTRIERLRGAADNALAGLARTMPGAVGRKYVMQPLLASILGDLAPTLLITLAATALLLLLGCTNVSNLLLARGAGRAREIAVRAALGASRSRLVCQMLTEATAIAGLGAFLGFGCAYAGTRVLLSVGASSLPRLTAMPFDARVLVFVLAALLFTVLAMGVLPAWRLADTEVSALLNENSRNATPGRAASRSMSALIVGEIAIAVVLTAGAGWLVQSYAKLDAVDLGFTPAGRLVVNVSQGQPFSDPAKARAWSDEMFQRIRAVPGVGVVGSAATFPLGPENDSTTVVAPQGTVPDLNYPQNADVRVVSQDFFPAMGIRLLAGRDFTIDDRQDTQPVAIVNEAFVRTFLDGRNPLESQFRFGFPQIDPKSLHSIVGVVQDVRYRSLQESPMPTFYLVQTQMPYRLIRQSLIVTATSGDPHALISGIQSTLKAMDPLMGLQFETATDVVSATLTRQRLGMTLMLIFGVVALVLAAIGIYGVIAYVMAQRREEIAMRIALGASAGRVFWFVMGGGQRLTLFGVVLGLAGAYAGGLAVANRVYAMRADDPLILVASAATVAVVTLLATLIPAIRASRLDPSRILRSE